MFLEALPIILTVAAHQFVERHAVAGILSVWVDYIMDRVELSSGPFQIGFLKKINK